MRLTIDNLDGLGPIEYSDYLMAEGPVTIARKLNVPQTCTWTMRDCLKRPVRTGRVVVTGDAGAVLFTGYLPLEPEAVALGSGAGGIVYRLELSALSDEWLLDKQGLGAGGESFAESGDTLLRSLTSRVDGSRFTTTSTGLIAQVGSVTTSAARSWSENAGAIAEAAGASYRVLSGQVVMAPLGALRHTLTTADDSLSESGLRLGTARELVNDVTISGEIEGGTYVTEIFVGDGTTSAFTLSSAPFAEGSAASRTIVQDDFSAGVLDPQQWTGGDPGSHLTVGAGGLMLGGGTGLDGQTTLIAASAVELGGVVVLEARNVSLGQGSDGVLLGLYSGPVSRATCVAGFDVRQASGATTLGAWVNGASAGTTTTLASGHMYTLRLHLHSTETQRVRQSYVVTLGGVPQQFGGGVVRASPDVVFEVVDLGLSSTTPATVLYDGTLANSPASVRFAPVNSVQLVGTVGGFLAQRLSTVWVRGMTSAGLPVTRLGGVAGSGADFLLASAGVLRFFPGRVPAASEQIRVQYRRARRAVARVQAAASVAAEAKGGLPGRAIWHGSVVAPTAWSSEDCAAAASALQSLNTNRAEAVSGTYEDVNLPDIWPGDFLNFVTEAGAILVMVRRAQLVSDPTSPELVTWRLEFANDWVTCASLRLSKTLAADAGDVIAGGGSSTVPGLGGLQVVSISKSALQIDAGCSPPSGGGFEVRRTDGSFRAGQGGDLVLRSGVRGFTVPRGAQVEEFYVRMYDGSTPPVYSRLSSAVLTDVPIG